MENVILIVHLLLALSLIGIVLLQKSEGGGLGMGGGGGGTMSGRPPATPMGKVTWILAIAFICTSMALTIVAAQKSAGSSVLDRIGNSPISQDRDDPAEPAMPSGDGLLPPSSDDSAPLVPRAD